MKFKARIKTLSINTYKQKNNTIGFKYNVMFEPIETKQICGIKCFYEITDKNEIALKEHNQSMSYDVHKYVFNFLSEHSTEEFIVTIKDDKFEKVELIYG